MIVRELFTRLGLDVDSASFAEGFALVEVAKAGLGVLYDAASDVSSVFVDNVDAAGGWEMDLGAAADKTAEHFARAAENAKTIQDYIGAEAKRLWAGVLSYVLPVIQTITDYVRANVKFYGNLFSQAAKWISANWDVIKYAILGGVTAITAAMVILHWSSVKAAAASLAAWLAAAWPFILIGGLIAGILLALDDVRVYLEGGNSLIGRFINKWRGLVDQWKDKPADQRPWWYSILVAITKDGAIKGWFDALRSWVSDVWERIKGIDWSPITGFFGWLAGKLKEVDWEAWGKRIKAVVITIGQEVGSVNFKGWILKLEGFVLKLEYAYLVAKNLVAMIGRGIDALGSMGRSISGVGEWAGGLFRKEKTPAQRAEQERTAPSEPEKRVPTVSPDAYWTAPTVAYDWAPTVQQTTSNTYHVTQLPGENGEDFARRVAEISDERARVRNEEAAASIPAVE